MEEIVSSGQKKPRKKPGINRPPEETANPAVSTLSKLAMSYDKQILNDQQSLPVGSYSLHKLLSFSGPISRSSLSLCGYAVCHIKDALRLIEK